MRSHFTQNYENDEYIIRDTTGEIIRRSRKIFYEKDQIYIIETVDEKTQKATFRNIMRLDKNNNIISMTVFSKTDGYIVNHFYDERGFRIKTIKHYENKLTPKIEIFERYDNGLVKKEIRGNSVTEYEYEYW